MKGSLLYLFECSIGCEICITFRACSFVRLRSFQINYESVISECPRGEAKVLGNLRRHKISKNFTIIVKLNCRLTLPKENCFGGKVEEILPLRWKRQQTDRRPDQKKEAREIYANKSHKSK